MNRQAVLFLVLAVIFGLGAAFTAQEWLARNANRGASVETVPVVVARAEAAVGTRLQANQLQTVDWPRAFAPAGSFRSVRELEGRVLRRPVAVGEPVLTPVLAAAGTEAGLGSVISSEMRAISVKVDPVIGVAGFVRPGDKVDVLATLRRIDMKDKLPYTKVILQDVRVLAIDQKLEEASNGDAKLVSVVTLEVDPVQAEKVTYISHEGRLQLALRNPSDRELVETKSVGVAELMPRPRPVVRSNGGGYQVQIVRGADVSARGF